ncbi:spore protein Tlp [Solibacillus sp. FSL H8-0538]|uniref:spore protein Tlp n=1 Tax=Solibacillus sp. FSL H8-0538 TaxID=2921400 RepID=UPI0030FA036D
MSNQKNQEIDRKSTNALSLERMIENTKKNIQEAEISMEFAGPEELENLEEKNERREHSIDIMKKQKRDEAAAVARKNSFK